MALSIEGSWFLYEDHAAQPRASVTTSDTGADAVNASPVAYVLDRFSYRQWQSPSYDDWFEIDFGADVELQAFAVIFPRITNPYRKYETQEIIATDLVQHLVDADGGTPGAGAVLDTGQISCGALPTRGYSVAALTTSVTGRYWRCQITANSRTSDDFFLVSMAMAGPVFQPAYNHVFGERIAFSDNSELQRTPTGQIGFPTRNERTLAASCTWDFIQNSERPSWEAMAEYSGNTEPVLFALSNDDATAFTSDTGPNGWIMEGDRVMAGVFTDDLSTVSRQLDANIRQIQMTEHR